MKNTKKVLLGGVAALALVGTSVFGTYMYLTSQDCVTNTFTVGKVAITLDESKVDETGKIITGDGAAQVDANKYHIYPGETYDKNPIVHVDANSEESYLFVLVENGLLSVPTTVNGQTSAIKLEAESSNSYKTIDEQIKSNHWEALYTVGNTTLYSYITTVSGKSDDLNIEVFQDFKISSTLTTEQYESLNKINVGNEVKVDTSINITAYAVQAKGFTSVTDAWNATYATGTGITLE